MKRSTAALIDNALSNVLVVFLVTAVMTTLVALPIFVALKGCSVSTGRD